MSVSALSSGLSGLKAYSTALDSSGHNVANASTAGFIPQQASFQEQPAGGVIANISKEGSSLASQELSGTDLANEIVQSLQFKLGFDLSAKVVKTADEVLGTLIDIKA
ncbi:flagellar basal body rod C-terminal domain-containing protein [Undibacterium pigrum]|uniref:Flagellar basal-body rod protein FlgC n=1 Tax=Undibacterium pigrum TaxID=401470 RepID=A0A318JCG7_9BURK|nr:flagellar basal body rod C-terminal domain-containing protein [Undibacterium pigrum]PXX46601.1 flagellar basal-body rod protein FlgC [Undibacterium pigrum]